MNALYTAGLETWGCNTLCKYDKNSWKVYTQTVTACKSERLFTITIFGTHRPPGGISLGRCLPYCFCRFLWPLRGQDCPTDQTEQISTLSKKKKKNCDDVHIIISSGGGAELPDKRRLPDGHLQTGLLLYNGPALFSLSGSHSPWLRGQITAYSSHQKMAFQKVMPGVQEASLIINHHRVSAQIRGRVWSGLGGPDSKSVLLFIRTHTHTTFWDFTA